MTSTYTTKITNMIVNGDWRSNNSPFCEKCWNGVSHAKKEFSIQNKFIINHLETNIPVKIFDYKGVCKFDIFGSLFCFCRTDIWVFYTTGEDIRIDRGLGMTEAGKSADITYVDMINYTPIGTYPNKQFIAWLDNDSSVEMDPRGIAHMDHLKCSYYKQKNANLYFRSFEKQVQKPKEIADLEKENNTMKEELAMTKSELEKLKQKVADFAEIAKSFEKINGMM